MLKRAWVVFAIVFCWKVALLVFTVQPVPANDAFFFDGAVSHQLLHGGFYNPSLAEAFPILGTQFFSAYPPMYQVALKGWMTIFGVSAFSSISMHVVLLGIYMLVLLAIFRRLLTPTWCVQIGGTFLFLFTFNDRPDTLAHVFGMLAVYGWVRSRPVLSGKTVYDRSERWTWLMILFVILSLCTSLQIGTVYLGWVWLGNAIACYLGKERFPAAALLVNLLVPVALVLIVKLEFPLAWAGFRQNLAQTKFFTGLRLPPWPEVARIVRTAPGVLVVTLLLPWSLYHLRKNYQSIPGRRNLLVLVPGLLAAAGIMFACFFMLAPNTSATIVSYLQPLAVICYLAVCGLIITNVRWQRFSTICLLLAMLLGSIRAIGMTTWGVLCARDVSYWSAIARVSQELDRDPPGTVVIISSAFLYEAARHDHIKSIHSDWLKPTFDPAYHTVEELVSRKPVQLILTQFDYYRQYEDMLAKIKADPRLAEIKVENLAKIRTPDSMKSMRQVVQHISWAPVIVNLTWN